MAYVPTRCKTWSGQNESSRPPHAERAARDAWFAGGYLVWFLKERKVFMDSRQDLFPEDLILQQIRVESSGDYRPLFNQFGIRCASCRAAHL